MEGADAVLGVQWLKMLGHVVTDYEKLSMKFVWDGNLVHLEGESADSVSVISPKKLRRLTLTNSVASLFQLTLVDKINSDEFDAPVPSDI